MGCSTSKRKNRASRMVEAAVQRAEQRCGKAVIHARYHVLPRCLEDDYEVTGDVLGSGMNGSVFKCRCKRYGHEVAVKSFRLRGISRQQVSQLESETEIFLSMNHPHVADLMDVYRSDDKLSLVMECLSGGEVLDRVIERQSFPEQETANTLRQMLLAVSYIHAHDVVHRDLKLENFLYERKDGDHLKLIDFGFSRIWRANESAMSLSLGSLQYVAPEVLGRSYGSKCDLWSMGVIAFVLLSGGFPFAEDSRPETMARIKGGNRHDLPWGKVSAAAEDFVDRLLVVDPTARLSAEDALRHNFIDDTFLETAKSRSRCITVDEVDKDISDALQQFAKASRFRRVCMSLMAWSLTNEEQARVRDEFLAIDQSRRGTITLEEMRQALMAAGVDKEQAEACFAAIDLDKTGQIKYSEFLAAMVSTRITMHDELIRRAFQRFDVGCSGFITLEDLKALLGESFEGAEVEELLQEADFQKKGQISFEDFTTFLMGDDGPSVESSGNTVDTRKSKKSRKSRRSVVTVKLLEEQAIQLKREFSGPSLRKVSGNSSPPRKVTEDSGSTATDQLRAQLRMLQNELEATRTHKRAGNASRLRVLCSSSSSLVALCCGGNRAGGSPARLSLTT